MAVQAHLHSHAFPHDLPVYRALEDATTGRSLFLDEHGGCSPAMAGIIGTTVFSDFPGSDLTCNGNSYSYGFMPRKRARTVAEDQERMVQTPAAAQGLVPVGGAPNMAVASGAASTSGRMANAAGLSQGLLPQLYHQGMEIDALVRVETERMRAVLEEARRRHARALVAAAERAAAGRLRAAEAAVELARCRNVEMEEKLREMTAEGQAWVGVARSHEAVAACFRATLDQLLQSPCAAPAGSVGDGDAEDAQSCCFESPAGAEYAASKASAAACKACSEGEACVLLLPCRHLCLCRACGAAADTCPVCAATKNASLHVLLS